MEMGYYARRTLVPAVMAWVEQSKLRKHLPAHECLFVKDLGDGYLEINLSYLDEVYTKKHIKPDMDSYCDAFTNQLKPVIKAWCIKCNIYEAQISLRFKAHCLVNTGVTVNMTWQELKDHQK